MVDEVAEGIEAGQRNSRVRLPAAPDSLRYRNLPAALVRPARLELGRLDGQAALNWLVVSQLYHGREAALPVPVLNASRLVPIPAFTPSAGCSPTASSGGG